MKKLAWPIAKIREDGIPAVWLTFDNWLVIKDGIIRTYLLNREWRGAVLARREKKRPDTLDTMPFELDNIKAAMALYEVAWQTYQKHIDLSPEALVTMGDRHQKQGYDNEIARLEEQKAQVPA